MNKHSRNHPSVIALKESLTTEEYFEYMAEQKKLRQDKQDDKRMVRGLIASFGMFLTLEKAPTVAVVCLAILLWNAYPIVFRKYDGE